MSLRSSFPSLPWLALPVFVAALAAAPNGDQTRLLRSPTVSATQNEQLVGRRTPQLPGRPEPSDLDCRYEVVRLDHAAVDRLERHGSRLGRRLRVLPLRSQRRVERVGVRAKRQEADAAHTVHRFRREDDRRRRWQCGLRAGRVRARARSEVGEDLDRQHPRHRELSMDDAAVGGRHHSHDGHRAVASRQAGRGRGARRDLHDSGRKSGRAQPESLERFGRA